MSLTNERGLLILEHEEQFANRLAIQVIEKPKLSIWMILIPIIFVYYFYQFQKYNAGRKEFSEHYMFNRKLGLREAVMATETGKPPDIDGLVNMSDAPEAARGQYAELIGLLVEHYTDILRSDGKDFDALVRSAYKSRTNFLLFLNRLNQAEKAFNAAIKPHISESPEVIDRIISNMEDCSEKLRRDSAERIFT